MGILLSGAPSSFGVVVSLFVNGWFVMCGFPSREGIKGCVMERGAVGVEMFLLLFGGVVFLVFSGARWCLLASGGCF